MLCLIADEVDFDYLVKVVSSLLHYEATAFPFMISCLTGSYFKTACILCVTRCVVSDSLRPYGYGLQPARFLCHGISQARILEWVAISFSGDLPDSGIKPESPALQSDSLLSEPPRNPLFVIKLFTH